jgi:glycosyltransferase involved in cell wall biosynthesis
VVVDARVEDPRLAASDVDLAVIPVRSNRTGDVSLLTARAWLAAGVPVMASASRGLAGLVDDGVDGRLLPAGDRHALARALLRVADDPSLLEDMSHAAAARHGARRPSAIGRGRAVQDVGSNAANASAASR